MIQTTKIRNLTVFVFFIITAAIFYQAACAGASERVRGGEEGLRETYSRISAKMGNNCFGVPLYVESSDRDGRLDVDVYGVVDHPFGSVLHALSVPSNWCEIVSLHPNVKACTHRELHNEWLLTLYSGRKTYQPPEDAHRLTYHYRTTEEREGFLDIVLSAEEGPFGTKNHRMKVEAVRLDSGRTLVRVRYICDHGFLLHLAGNLYFSTLGRGKVGFTVDGTDREGAPVYIGGPRGAIERNAVRYYLAIQSFMDAIHYPKEERFLIMISEWYDLTDRFRKQLYEMDKKDYLAFKTAEHENQVMLQQRLTMGAP